MWTGTITTPVGVLRDGWDAIALLVSTQNHALLPNSPHHHHQIQEGTALVLLSIKSTKLVQLQIVFEKSEKAKSRICLMAVIRP